MTVDPFEKDEHCATLPICNVLLTRRFGAVA
jgi:hypothetical protein